MSFFQFAKKKTFADAIRRAKVFKVYFLLARATAA